MEQDLRRKPSRLLLLCRISQEVMAVIVKRKQLFNFTDKTVVVGVVDNQHTLILKRQYCAQNVRANHNRNVTDFKGYILGL
jgi:hypothetical protein